ncbi:MAG: hypothetical protein AB1782_13365 [Cyanobacteriota bacterium]
MDEWEDFNELEKWEVLDDIDQSISVKSITKRNKSQGKVISLKRKNLWLDGIPIPVHVNN